MTLPLAGPLQIRVVRGNLQSYDQGSPSDLCMDSEGNSYIATYYSPNLVKYDKDLNLIWSKTEPLTGASYAYLSNAVMNPADPLGRIVTAGFWTGSTPYEVYVQEWLSNGTLQWSTLLSESSSQVCLSASVDTSGNVYTVGYYIQTGGLINGYIVKLDANGNYLWNKMLSFASPTTTQFSQVQIDRSGNALVLGFVQPPGGNQELLLVKYDPSGNLIQQNFINADGVVFQGGLPDLHLDAFGNIYISGRAISGSQPFTYLMKLNSSVQYLWAKTQTLTGYYSATGGLSYVDSSGNVYLVCMQWTGSTVNRFFVFKYNLVGDLVWQKVVTFAVNIAQVMGIKKFNGSIYVYYQESTNHTCIVRFPDIGDTAGYGSSNPAVLGINIETCSVALRDMIPLITTASATEQVGSPSVSSLTPTVNDSGLVSTITDFTSPTTQSLSMLDMIREFDDIQRSPGQTNEVPLYITSQGNGYYAIKFGTTTPNVGARFFFAYPNQNVALVTSWTPDYSGTFPREVIIYSPNYTPTRTDTWYTMEGNPQGMGYFYSGITRSNNSLVSVPSGTTGYPFATRTSTVVPISGQISINNFSGAKYTWPGISAYMTDGIFSGSTDADNLYFGGQIPNGAGWVYRKSNNSYGSFSVPTYVLSPTITIDSWSLYIAIGLAYTYSEDAYGNRSYTYYNDYMKDYGILVYDNTANTPAGTIVNPTQVGSSGSSTYGAANTIPAGTLSLTPGHNYSLYYYSGFYMTSNIGYGDFSFCWYNYSYPHYTVSGITP